MRLVAALVSLGLLAGAAPSASAESKAMKVLKAYEKKYTNYQALYIKMKLYVGGQHKATLESRNRNNGQRLLKLLHPGDVKGMHILVQSQSEMYIYLPAFRKVRRIAGHVRNQGFLGSGFTYDDMAINKWSRSYKITMHKETPKKWVVDCKALPGKVTLYHHVRIHIRKDNGYASDFQYFNARGKNFKTQRFLQYKCETGKSHCNPWRIEMVEHTRGNRRSVLRNVRVRYKKRFPDRMYTVRYLVRSAN